MGKKLMVTQPYRPAPPRSSVPTRVVEVHIPEAVYAAVIEQARKACLTPAEYVKRAALAGMGIQPLVSAAGVPIRVKGSTPKIQEAAHGSDHTS